VEAETRSSRRLSLWIPFLPPSENHIRVHRRQGGSTYSTPAKDFKKRFSDHVRRQYLAEVSNFVRSCHNERAIYRLDMTFTFETVINKGWAKKQAKTQYKKFDVGNRRKLLEDCLVEVLGEIDDSLFFEVNLTKSMGPDVGVRLYLHPVTPADYGVPDVRRA